jgi:hypothetical protein
MKLLKSKVLKLEQIRWKELNWLQGNLKEITQDDFNALINLILENDFKYPFTIWEDKENQMWILDGTHRKQALMEIEEKCLAKIPDVLPAIFIECKNKREAVKSIFEINSSFAKMIEQGVYELTQKYEIDYKDLESKYSIHDIDYDHFTANYFEEPSIDTKKSEEKTCPHCGLNI